MILPRPRPRFILASVIGDRESENKMPDPTSAPPGLAGRMSGKEWPVRYVFYAVLLYALIQTSVLFYKIMIKNEHPSDEVRRAKEAAERTPSSP